MKNNLFSDTSILMKKIFYRCEDAKMRGCVAIFSTPLRILSSCLLFTFYFLLFTSSALADDSNWGIQPPSTKQVPSQASQKVWENEQSEKLYENYGSQDSPAFLNRENIDPATSEYEEKYDYEDDEPYNYDAGGN